MPDPAALLPDQIDLDAVVEILRRKYDLDAHVEQTGGGGAAILAGVDVASYVECTCKVSATLKVHEDPCPVPARGGSPRRAAVAGPGSYGWGKRASTANWDEFYIGPDDDSATDAVSAVDVGARSYEDVADLIHAQATKIDSTLPLGADSIDALGFDSSGRGAPRDLALARERENVRRDAANESNRRLIADGLPADERVPLNDVAGAAAVALWESARKRV